MLRLPAVAVCAALLFGSTVTANAGTTGNGMPATGATVATRGSVSVGQSGPKVVIVLHIATPMAYTYDPATGGMTTLTPVPAENQSPIPSIGIVVKKNPGGSAARMAGDSNGVFAFPSSMEIGNYDIVITIPAHAINTKGTGSVRLMASKGATITLHVTVGAKGNIRMTQGTLPSVMQQPATNTQ